MLSECISSWSVLHQHNNLFTICTWPQIWPKEERKKKKTHLTARDYGCSYSPSHCGSTTGTAWGGRQACTLPDEEWTRLDKGQVPCGRGCAGTQMGTPGKLGGLCEQPRASHLYLRCECCSWTGSGTCSKQIQAPSKSTEGVQHMAANPGKEKARFPFTHKHGLITKSALAVKLVLYNSMCKKGLGRLLLSQSTFQYFV